MSTPVAILLVSHSQLLAEGLRDLAAQMAPSVQIVGVGGLPGGALGTSFDQIAIGLETAFEGAEEREVAIFADLGSSIMTIETVLELMANSGEARIVHGPFVEGAVAAAVIAEQRGSLTDVVTGGENAVNTWAAPADDGIRHPQGTVTGSARVVDAVGIHARPAAELAKLAGTFDADIRIRGVDAKSVLQVMTLGVRFGETVELEASGPQAHQAVDALTMAIGTGFDK